MVFFGAVYLLSLATTAAVNIKAFFTPKPDPKVEELPVTQGQLALVRDAFATKQEVQELKDMIIRQFDRLEDKFDALFLRLHPYRETENESP